MFCFFFIIAFASCRFESALGIAGWAKVRWFGIECVDILPTVLFDACDEGAGRNGAVSAGEASPGSKLLCVVREDCSFLLGDSHNQ